MIDIHTYVMVRRRVLNDLCTKINSLAMKQNRHVETRYGYSRSLSSKDIQDAIKSKDERVYGGLKSWDILVSESSYGKSEPATSKSWHAWQLFTATLPALAIYLISTSQEEQAMRAKDEVDGAMIDENDQTKTNSDVVVQQKFLEDINKRLAALESQVHAVVASSSGPHVGVQETGDSEENARIQKPQE